MTTTTFKGARYIVKFHNPIEWDSNEIYEAIEAVKHDAYTYISKQPVPAGVDISNTDFWLLWADPNAQMAELRILIGNNFDVDNTISDFAIAIQDSVNDIQAEIGTGFDAENTISDAIAQEENERKATDELRAIQFDTVADMKASSDLVPGMYAETNGFYSFNDGGNANYKILDSGTANEIDTIAVGDYYAQLIFNGEVKARALGMKPADDFDNMPILRDFLTKYVGNKAIKITFDAGIYRFSQFNFSGTNRCGNFELVGTKNAYGVIQLDQDTYEPLIDTFIARNADSMTIFAPIGTQNYIFYFDGMQNVIIRDVLISSISNNGNDNSSNMYKLSNAAIVFEHMVHSALYGVNFQYIIGTALKSQDSYEINVDNCNFRWVVALNNPTEHGCIEFCDSPNVALNSSAWIISNINFEFIYSHWIYANNARVQNIACSNIIGESGRINAQNSPFVSIITTLATGGHAVDYEHSLGVVASKDCTELCGFSFESISIDNLGLFYQTSNSVDYNFNCIMSTKSDTILNVIVGNLQLSAPRDITWLYNGSAETTGYSKSLVINGIIYDGYGNAVMRPMRGTLSHMRFNRPPQRFSDDTRIFVDFEKLFGYMPNFYYSGQRMWKESAQSYLDVSKIAPIIDTTNKAYKKALQIPATGYSKIIVLTTRDSHFTVELDDLNGTKMADATTDQSASYKAYIVDVAAVDATQTNTVVKKCVNVYGDGEHAEEIFDVICR